MKSTLYTRAHTLLFVVITFLFSFPLFAQDTITYNALLTGRSEVHPVVTPASGSITAQLVGNQLTLSGTFKQLSSSVLDNGVNVHLAYAGQQGAVTFSLTPNLDADRRGGQIDGAVNTFSLTTEQLESFAQRQLYVNVETALYSNGEIRGQLIGEALTYFSSNLYGSNEVPSIVSRAWGALVLELTSANQLVVSGSFSGLEGDFDASIGGGVHIHIAAAGANGDVTLVLVPSLADDLRGGVFKAEDNTFEIDIDQLIALGERKFYANIHTIAYPSGELRGQFIPLEATSVYRVHLSGTNTMPIVSTRAHGMVLAESYSDTLMILSGAYSDLSSSFIRSPNGQTGLFEGLTGTNGELKLPLSITQGRGGSQSAEVEAANNVFLLDKDEADLLQRRAMYLSIGSMDHPNGELRGQLLPEAQMVFSGFLSGALVVPPVHTYASGGVQAELRGNILTVSGSYNSLENEFANNIGICSGMAGTNGEALFRLNAAVATNNRGAAVSNTIELTDAQVEALINRTYYVNVPSGNDVTQELRAQLLPEATAYFLANLSGTSHTPIIDTEGNGQLILEVHEDLGILTGSFQDLSSPLNIDAAGGAHLHNGIAGRNGDITVGIRTNLDSGEQTGTFNSNENTVVLEEDFLTSLFAREQYANIHTQEFGSGEIRGQLLPFSTTYYTSTLSGLNLIDPITNEAIGALKADLVGNKLTLTGSFDQLSTAATTTALNLGVAGTNGTSELILTSVEANEGTSGVFLGASNQFELTDEQLAALKAEQFYINITTDSSATGEARGQLLAEPNYLPTGDIAFQMPVNGTFFTSQGDPTAPFNLIWTPAIDNNPIYYIFQVSDFVDFRTIDEQEVVLNDGLFPSNLRQLDSILMDRGVAIGDTTAFYYRMLSMDGSGSRIGQSNFITIVRGGLVAATGADLEVDITGPEDLYEIFSEIPYTISVTNNGPEDAEDITVNAKIPEGMVFTRANQSQGRFNTFFQHWRVGDLAVGETATLDLTLFTLIDGQPITNFVEVAGSLPLDPDSRPNNGTPPTPQEDDEAAFTIFTEIRPMGGDTADLELTMHVEDETFQAFDNATFFLTLVNQGPDDAANIKVSTLFPEGTVFTDAIPSTGEFNVGAQDWSIPLLANGDTARLELTLYTLLEGRPIGLFCQVIETDQIDPDSTPANDLDNTPDEDDEALITILPEDGIMGGTTADLELDIIVDREAYEIFTNYTYTITLTNNGPDDATNIFVDAQLPDSLAYTGKAASIGDWNNFFQFWIIPFLPAGEQHTLKLVLFTLSKETPINYFTQITRVDQDDPDSAPDNNLTGIPNEDDEASVTISPNTDDGNINPRSTEMPALLGALYPVPAQTDLNLVLMSPTTQQVDILITDINGQQIQERTSNLKIGHNHLQFQIEDLAEGMYFIQLLGEQLPTQWTWKFVKTQ